MKDQIVKLMETEGLSPARFADEIGVQRSSISHIISGRNKPSYDFILKIISRFTGIDTNWLLTGQGSMIKQQNQVDFSRSQSNLFNDKHDQKRSNKDLIDPTGDNQENNSVKAGYFEQKDIFAPIEKKSKREFTNVNNIDFIMVFYSDGTFKRYSPRE